MESIKISELVQCVSQFLMRELHELSKTQKRISVSEYCSKTRSLLKRLKKIISWLRVSSQTIQKQQELEDFISSRLTMQKSVSNLVFSLHNQQLFSLRTPPFAISEASDVLCRGEYCGFPNLGFKLKPSKIPLSKFTRIIKHKALMSELPIGAEIEISNGKLQVIRDEHEIIFSLNENLKWLVFDFKVKHQELNIPQKEIILKDILDSVNKCSESEVLIVTDSHLKKTSHCALLEILYKQSKSLRDVNVQYAKNISLALNYWPAFPSVLSLIIGEEGIEISHSPILSAAISFSKDLSEILNQAIFINKKDRLEALSSQSVTNRLQLDYQNENLVTIDISFFSGEYLVFIMGKHDPELSTLLRFQSLQDISAKLEEKVLKKKFQSVCRSLDKELVQEPLRFCRSFYNSVPGFRKSGVLGYIDLGSVLPIDSMGHIIIFALRVLMNPISSELVGFNQTEEEYTIPIHSSFQGSILDYVKNCIRIASEKIMLLRIPVMLLAKPDI